MITHIIFLPFGTLTGGKDIAERIDNLEEKVKGKPRKRSIG